MKWNKSKILILVTSILTIVLSVIWLKFENFKGLEQYAMLIATVISVFLNFFLDRTIISFSKKPDEKQITPSYSEKFETLLNNLKSSSKEIDKAFEEIKNLSIEKEKSLNQLEQTLTSLTEKEHELNTKIKTLEKVPIEAIKHFEDVLSKGDKRSAYRDYLLFLLGIFVSIIISIVLKKLNIA